MRFRSYERLSNLCLYAFIFGTGATGLIYQVVWQKYLSRLLGADSIAIAIILGVFLGGLSVGYYLCGLLTTKISNYFKTYAILEGVIGAWCLLFPLLFEIVDSLTRSWSFTFPYGMILQGFVCSIILMGVPTVCMGGTVPVLTRAIAENIEETTRINSIIYSINTIGAFGGTLLAGFYLIPRFGLPLTVMGSAIINLGAALYFYLLGSFRSAGLPADFSQPPDATPAAKVEDQKSHPFPLYLIAFLSGFYVMTLENVLMRLSALSLGSSSYTYSLIVAVFIFSIAAGSFIVSRIKMLPEKILFYNQIGIAISLFFIYFSLDSWPYWAHIIRIAFQANVVGFWAYWLTVFLALIMLLFVPVSLMGATLPLVFHFIKRRLRDAGRHTGYVFSWNTAGSLIGSIIGGIVAYYFLNIAGIFLLAVLLAGVSACLTGWYAGRRYFLATLSFSVIVGAVIFSPPYYDIEHFKLGTFRLTGPLASSLSGPEKFFRAFSSNLKLAFYKDGSTATVAVLEGPYDENFKRKARSIIINGKSDSNTLGDMVTLKLLAHIPVLLSDKPDRVMVIGIGTGVTAGELTLHPQIKEIHIAEISPEVYDTLKYFRDSTYGLEKDKRVKVHLGDAFRILGRSDMTYDVIISEPSNPWTTGVDLLFTSEFYRLVKERLSKGGIFFQWMQSYSADIEMIGMILNTMNREFENIHVFVGIAGDLLIMAGDRPVTRDDLLRADHLLSQNAQLKKSLEEIKIESIDGILLREIINSPYITNYFSDFGTQTMDFPRLHYLAGRQFFLDSRTDLADIMNSSTAPYAAEYLLSRKYGAEEGFSIDKKQQQRFKNSLTNIRPIADALTNRALLQRPEDFPLVDRDKEALNADLVALIMNPKPDSRLLERAGLAKGGYRKKIETLLREEKRTRNWLVPYRIEGLKVLLEEGILNGKDDYEKNWSALQLALLLFKENRSMGQLQGVLSRTIKDEKGGIIIKSDDRWLETAALEALAKSLQKPGRVGQTP